MCITRMSGHHRAIAKPSTNGNPVKKMNDDDASTKEKEGPGCGSVDQLQEFTINFRHPGHDLIGYRSVFSSMT